jgi:type IV secretory pathway VirB2 component (pilin)
MSTLLVLKLVLVPSLILAITFAGRRWGPAVAGWLSGFPVVSGPILFFMATEQGLPFASAAAVGTLSAVLAIVAFGLSYAWAATRLSWPGCLLCGLLAYFAAVALLNALAPPVFVAAPFVIVALWFAPRLFPRRVAPPPALAAPRGELVLRVLTSAALVISVTYFASPLGPRLSGLFAMFPVINSVLAVFSHLHAGRQFTVKLLRGMVLGYYAFATFCFVLALSLTPLGMALSFALSFCCATLVQVTSSRFMHRT